jgi:2-desacetyl-2-hydroxyethyl bacteriochlorophyllide A dehydrogenase
MRAVVLDPDGTLSLRERPKPSAHGECLIRVLAAGICGTDLELIRGYAGFSGVPGHEFVGIVEAGDPGWVGRRVVGEITVGCERCVGCRAAGRGHCDVRTVLGIRGRDGAFADYVSLPVSNLHAVPASVDDETAVFVEPTAAACRIVEQVRIDPGTRTAVVGAGRLGLLIAQVLRQHGAQVTVVTRSARSQAMSQALDFETIDVDSAVDSLGRQFAVAVDATGDPAGFTLASALLRPLGTLVLKSTFHGETPVSFSPLVVDEIAIVGSRCGPFSRAIELLADGRIEVKALVVGSYPLERFAEAFDAARRGLKVILKPGAASA